MLQNSGSNYDGAMVGIKPSVTTHPEPFDKSRKLGRVGSSYESQMVSISVLRITFLKI